MKHDYQVRAYRTETKYDTRDNLMSLLDVQVPADALEFLRAAHNAQDSKDVTFTVQVVNQVDGDFRTLKFTSKGSKMKDFVPVATLEKWCDPHDNLTALFDRMAYELNLVVEVKERQRPDADPLFEDDQEGDESQSETVAAGVLNAPKEVPALPSSEPEVQDVDFRVLGNGEDAPEVAASINTSTEAETLLEQCNADQLARLCEVAQLSKWKLRGTNPSEATLMDARTRLLKEWDKVEGSEVLAQVKAELEAPTTAPAEAEETPAEFLARCNIGQLSILMEVAGFDVTDWDDPKSSNDKDTAEWRELLIKNWEHVEGTGGWATVRDQLAHPAPVIDDLFDGDDMPFGPGQESA